MKGNVVDIAVEIMIGVAFGKIVACLVRDVIMPPIDVLVGGVDFSELANIRKEAQGEAAAVAINYGLLIQSINQSLIFLLLLLRFSWP
jgi:large conductance mechanosensitive channel